MKKENKIAIIGLGYVGLPLALAFSKHYKVLGYDVNERRVSSLQKGIDSNLDVAVPVNSNLVFSSNESTIKEANIYIITVPTPVNVENIPDLSFLQYEPNWVPSIQNSNFEKEHNSDSFFDSIRAAVV